VVPFDWGGWSTLQVTAVLEGGRRLTGRLKGELEAGLRVPKRARDSYIADGWKKATGAHGTDLSDDENSPVGDRTKGDGLTLYEEYRGFYEAGEHIEGDPHRKDFFVRLKHAGIALPGVAKFQIITNLNVHYNFTGREFPDSRIINANRGRGPNHTDQHGVVVQVNKDQKGFAIARSDKERPGNPKTITTVDLMADAARVDPAWLESTVAHELGHCVNLWHHGDSDDQVEWTVRDGRLYEQILGVGMMGFESPILTMNEKKIDFTARTMAVVRALPGGTLTLWMGRYHGQHSGDDNCMMRYDCAETYVYRPKPNYRVILRKGDEPVGNWICDEPKGTGVNLIGHDPIDRYGAATAKRGNCVQQILVNDSVEAPSR